MKVAALVAVVLAAGCLEDVTQPWQLDDDRIVVVRATPPHILVGEVAQLDGLIGHANAPAEMAPIILAATVSAPADLDAVLHFDIDHYEVDGRLMTEDQLAAAREQLGLPAGTPVPLDVLVQFPDRPDGQHLIGRKTVYLGDHHDNPALPAISIGGAPAGDVISLPVDQDVPLVADAPETGKPAPITWLTSCGTLHDFDEPAAFVHVEQDDRKQGELAVVFRDGAGGVAWRVWPCEAH